jgi:hypothetical protein
VDLNKIIHDLRQEKAKLDQIIASLEELQSETGTPARPTSRRGRRFMGAEDRLEVSRRMKKYWENRRRQAAAEPEPEIRATGAGTGLTV